MTAEDNPASQAIDWHWVAEARLAAMRMQSLPEARRVEAVTIARTTMLALTAYRTPIGHSPIPRARDLAEDLAAPYPYLEATAAHCVGLLFFFDSIESKEYHNIGLPWEFWRFGELMLSGIGFNHRPFFTTARSGVYDEEADAWVVDRADQVRQALAAVAGRTEESGGSDGRYV
ncbi:hypothetical protein [Microbacterium sp.]|uniref:hypothetical protein n=1 Tax=Microbacterium sp. TaxID=51671 RepID=UPI0025D05E13|nr:hypothetical protein [Microbacterium sp.]